MKHNSFFLVPLLAGALALPAGAAPLISANSGLTANGNNVTVIGSGFGTKSPAEPWLYDDFEGHGAGSSVPGQTSPTGGRQYSYYHTNDAVYDNRRSYSGSSAMYVRDSDAGSTVGHNIVVNGQATQRRYISYRWYRNLLGGGAGGVWKVDRQTSDLKNGNSNAPYDDCPNFGWGDYFYYNNCSQFINTNVWRGAPPEDRWNRMESWQTISSVDAANGTYQAWFNGDKVLDTGDIVTCTSASANGCRIDTWMSPTLANDKGQNEWWLDNLYIDNTLARVEIGDSPVWSNCKDRVLQIPTAWADGTVTFRFRQGGFTQGQTAYVFVVDASGNASNGYQIRIGDGVADASPPSPPGNIH